MLQVNIHEAKTNLSMLVDKVKSGESFVIAKSGKPLAKVIPYNPINKSRGGFLRGDFTIPDDFDTMFTDEIENLFGNGGESV